jgi:hypothetical protein
MKLPLCSGTTLWRNIVTVKVYSFLTLALDEYARLVHALPPLPTEWYLWFFLITEELEITKSYHYMNGIT